MLTTRPRGGGAPAEGAYRNIVYHFLRKNIVTCFFDNDIFCHNKKARPRTVTGSLWGVAKGWSGYFPTTSHSLMFFCSLENTAPILTRVRLSAT